MRAHHVLTLLLCLMARPVMAQEWRDALPVEVRQGYIADAEQYLGRPWQELPDSVFAEFKRTGRRVGYEQLCFARRRQLAVLAMAEVMERRGRFMDDIRAGIATLMAEPWWGIPAHYPKERPDSALQEVDLFNAETAGMLAWMRHALAGPLGDTLAGQIDDEIERRLLVPALAGDYWWKRAGMNWNPWICSNWLACVCYCEHDEERCEQALRQIGEALRTFVDAYPADGGCDEGPGYWDRAAASLFDCLWLLRASGRAIGLPQEKIRAMGSYIYKMYVGDDYVVNFADAHDNRSVAQLNVLAPFACYLADSTMLGYAAWMARQASTRTLGDGWHRLYLRSGNFPAFGRELVLLRHYRQLAGAHARQPLLADVWLPDLQVMTARGQTDSTGGLFVAVKGGHNGESHNHNDVGSFIVYADGEPLLIDPGVGEYTSTTFSAHRYDIWTMQSGYHNLPAVNGVDQCEGREYAARDVTYRPGSLSMDIAPAYPREAEVASWRRSVTLRRPGGGAVVTDRYRLKAWKAPTRLSLMTTVRPVIERRGCIALGRHHIRYNPRRLTPVVEDISARLDPLLRQVWGSRLYRIVLTVEGRRTHGRLTVKIEE